MRVVAYPESGNYVNSLYKAIREQGCTVIPGVWAGRWIWANLEKNDVVHIHWPSFLYTVSFSNLASIKSLARYFILLALIRLRGGKIYWIAHNILPHDSHLQLALHKIARNFIISISEKVFVHGRHADRLLVDAYPKVRAKSVRVPHGNWIGYYGDRFLKTTARSKLGIPPDRHVYLCFGLCKPYRNIDLLVESFIELGDEDCCLVIAGRFDDEDYKRKVQTLASNHENIHIFPHYIADNEVADFLCAADVMCMPYRDILTSGTAVLSLSYGVPVISINRGFLKDLITSEAFGILLANAAKADLTEAMGRIRKMRFDHQEILEHAAQFTFQDAASIMLAEADKSIEASQTR